MKPPYVYHRSARELQQERDALEPKMEELRAEARRLEAEIDEQYRLMNRSIARPQPLTKRPQQRTERQQQRYQLRSPDINALIVLIEGMERAAEIAENGWRQRRFGERPEDRERQAYNPRRYAEFHYGRAQTLRMAAQRLRKLIAGPRRKSAR